MVIIVFPRFSHADLAWAERVPGRAPGRAAGSLGALGTTGHGRVRNWWEIWGDYAICRLYELYNHYNSLYIMVI